MRSARLYLVLTVAVSFSAMAGVVPFDPDILISDGGDATDINYTGVPITVGPEGGGIFVFHNATGNALNELDLNLNFPLSPLPDGFLVNGTISIPPSNVRQRSTFNVTTFSGSDCAGVKSLTFSCVELRFILTPGPLIPIGGNFVLDFNNTATYSDTDLEVLNGTYTGGDVPSGTGGWAPGGIQSSGTAQPPVPEPSYRATVAFMGLGLLVAWNCRRQFAAKKS